MLFLKLMIERIEASGQGIQSEKSKLSGGTGSHFCFSFHYCLSVESYKGLYYRQALQLFIIFFIASKMKFIFHQPELCVMKAYATPHPKKLLSSKMTGDLCVLYRCRTQLAK